MKTQRGIPAIVGHRNYFSVFIIICADLILYFSQLEN